LKDLTVSDEEINELPKTKIAIGKRSLQILQALYPKPNYEERTKNVDWPSFVSAMAEAGFAARQLHGSEYSFEPVPGCKWYGQGRIIFHKPRPEPKHEAWKLLNIGKRMGKWFDWDAGTFELLDSKLGRKWRSLRLDRGVRFYRDMVTVDRASISQKSILPEKIPKILRTIFERHGRLWAAHGGAFRCWFRTLKHQHNIYK